MAGEESGVTQSPGEQRSAERRPATLWRPLGRAFLGLALIIIGAEAVVQSALYFARALRLPEVVVGLTLVAIGTTLPDKVISISSAARGQSGVVTGNAIGSNIFNLLGVMGIAALVRPLPVDRATLVFDVPVMIGVTVLAAWMLGRRRAGRVEGFVLIGIYIIYLVANLAFKGRVG
ncbi:MAG: sodium:calcium antiporter [Bacillota bacterium]